MKHCGESCSTLVAACVPVIVQQSPYLSQVNHSPSWTCDSPLDHRIKQGVLKETMQVKITVVQDFFYFITVVLAILLLQHHTRVVRVPGVCPCISLQNSVKP